MNATRDLLKIAFAVAVVLGAHNVRADFTFGPRMDLGSAVNSPQVEGNPIISRNGLELYFLSIRPGGYGGWDIWMSKRASAEDPWGPPVNLGAGINSAADDAPESISSDGLTLYISATTSGVGSAMYTAVRPAIDTPWGPRVQMSPVLGQAWYAITSPDDLELYFMTTPLKAGGYDIWVSTRATLDDPWGSPVNLGPTINTGSIECPASVSPDGLILFIVTDRPGGFGRYDTWMARRPSIGAAWSKPVNLGPSYNTPSNDEMSCVSADGRWAYSFGDAAGGSDDMWQAPIIPIVDFSGDGKVDIQDLLRLIDSWGKDDPAVDVGPMPWGDGVVDEADLKVLMSYWGQEPCDPTLIAHWRLDETEGTVAADSAGAADGTLNGDPIWEPDGGHINGALRCDGVDDYVATPFVLDPGEGLFSVFAWVKGETPGQVILSQEKGANWLLAAAPQGVLVTELKSGRGGPLVSPAIITDGAWHRVGFVWDGSNRILYVDDVEAARDAVDGLGGSTGGLYIGAGKGLEAGSFWSGLIDDVRIYDRAVEP